MSEVVTYSGIIKEIKKFDENWKDELENYFFEKAKEKDLVLPNYYEDFTELFLSDENFYFDYSTFILYDTSELSYKEEDNEYFNSKKVKDGFEIKMKFYNGGCSYDEAIELSIKNT